MKQTNQQKNEMEWEKDMKKRLLEVRNHGGFITPVLEAIKELLAQSRQQFAEEVLDIIQERKEYHQRMGTNIEFHNGGVSACECIKELIRAKLTKK